jgi:hypothetical protein
VRVAVSILAVSEAGRPLSAVIDCWSAVWERFSGDPTQHTAALCLLLGNPLEVVEVACADADLSGKLHTLLGLCGIDRRAAHWDQLGLKADTLLIDVVKWLKAPRWRYRTEVLGLVSVAVQSVTQGAFQTVDQVRTKRLWSHGVACADAVLLHDCLERHNTSCRSPKPTPTLQGRSRTLTFWMVWSAS